MDDRRNSNRIDAYDEGLQVVNAVDGDTLMGIARRSRGTPRITLRLLRRVRDFVQVEGGETITVASAASALERLEVDEFGFDEVDRKILSTLIEQYGGGPAGIQAIAAAVGEDRGTLEGLRRRFRPKRASGRVGLSKGEFHADLRAADLRGASLAGCSADCYAAREVDRVREVAGPARGAARAAGRRGAVKIAFDLRETS